MRASVRRWSGVPAVLVASGVAVAAAGGTAGARGHHVRPRTRARISRARYGVEIQAVFTSGGNPLLVANFTPNGSLATARWSICSPPPASRCAAARARQAPLDPGPRPPGTTFRAAARYLGHRYTAQVTWHGRVTALSRPSLSGRLQVGAGLMPTAGLWRGGWGTEFDQLAVEACRTPSAGRCVMVSGGQLGCPGHSRGVIGSSVEGWYLFALDARSPADEVCAGVGYGSESAIPPWPTSRTVVRSAPRGPVPARDAQLR